MQAGDTLVGKRSGLTRFGGQSLRYQRVARVIGRARNKTVIPPKSNRKEVVSAIIGIIRSGKLKHYRRIATRYEKKTINYMEMLSFVWVLLWLR
jgi:transposase